MLEKKFPMIRAYRLVYPLNHHAPPQLWEYEQTYIHHLILNARTFDRRVVQWYFEDWDALDRDKLGIWDTYYRPSNSRSPVPYGREVPNLRNPRNDQVSRTFPKSISGGKMSSQTKDPYEISISNILIIQ